MCADIAVTTPQLILFAKKPAAGTSKTRLQPPLSPVHAAKVADILLRLSVSLAQQHWPGSVTLAVSPPPEDSCWSSFVQQHDISIRDQGPGELGERMYRALEAAPGPAAVMGCDVPHCPPAVLRRAFHALAGGYNVVGPSLDGGYYLLGVQHASPCLFEGVDWGSGRVMAQTLLRAGMTGLYLQCLPALRDLDRWEDINETRHHLPSLDRYLEQAGFSTAGDGHAGPVRGGTVQH